MHAAKTKQPLSVQVKLDAPRTVEKLQVSFDAKQFGMRFKKDAATIKETLLSLEDDKLQCIKDELVNG